MQYLHARVCFSAQGGVCKCCGKTSPFYSNWPLQAISGRLAQWEWKGTESRMFVLQAESNMKKKKATRDFNLALKVPRAVTTHCPARRNCITPGLGGLGQTDGSLKHSEGLCFYLLLSSGERCQWDGRGLFWGRPPSTGSSSPRLGAVGQGRVAPGFSQPRPIFPMELLNPEHGISGCLTWVAGCRNISPKPSAGCKPWTRV